MFRIIAFVVSVLVLMCERARAVPGDCLDDNPRCPIFVSACFQQQVKDICRKTCFSTTCAVRCTSQPPDVTNGSYSPQQSTYGHNAVVTYSCDTGFSISSGFVINRCFDGAWLVGAPVCSPICGPVPLNDNIEVATFHIGAFFIGDSVAYKCKDDAATLVGESTTTCLPSTEWSLTNLPTCEIGNACGLPPLAINGFHLPLQPAFAEGTTVTYRCNLLNIMIGSPNNTCIAGSWTKPAPVCYPGCEDYITYCNFFFVHKYCEVANSPVIPYCRKTCGLCTETCDNAPTSGGMIPLESGPYQVGSVIKYGCPPGLYLNLGPASADGVSLDENVCIGQDTWYRSSDDFMEAECGPFPCFTFPNVTSNGISPALPASGHWESLDTVAYVCISGYLVVGVQDNTCMNGTWSNSAPECKRMCDNPPTAAHLTVPPPSLATYVDGESVTYACVNGTVASNVTITCGPDGNWTAAPLPDCNCGVPPTPNANSHSSAGDITVFAHSEIVTYECDDALNYLISGSQNISCIEGLWNPNTAPVCLRICQNPPGAAHLTVPLPSLANYVVGESVTYSCVNGIVSSNVTITCGPDSNWTSATLPNCDCEAPTNGTFLQFEPRQDTYLLGEVVVYNCTVGFLQGNDTSSCNQGAWTLDNDLPECGCEAIPTTMDLVQIPEQGYYPFGADVEYMCDNSMLNLVGTNSTMCDDNGNWSLDQASLPTCSV